MEDSARGPSRGGRGPRGGRRGGRGRARGSTPDVRTHEMNTNPADSSGRPPGGGFGVRLTEAAAPNQDERKAVMGTEPQEQPVTDDVEVCFICASPIEHLAIAPCNHQTCHICSLRLRALYKTRACAHCRTEAPFVVFTDEGDRRFEDFRDTDFVKVDDNLGIKYEKDVILEDTVLLLRYNCPDKTCDVACLGWPDLHRHVKSKHAKVMCDLCTRNKKVFTHEHDLFTPGDLKRHEKSGDDRPGAEDQSGFKGHPECGFCKQRFYGDDELYAHCREKHERCHICDRRNASNGRSPQYYLNYAELEKHFADIHFVCLDAECQANKTNVFESEMDLQAHQLSDHPNGISKGREGRLINLSGFDLRTPYQPQRRGGRENRENRGSGRGRDPNADPLPVSSAQSLTRAELAYQRQVALSSAQSGPGRTFGGSLTQPAPTPRTQPLSRPPPTNPVPGLADLSVSTTATDATNMTPQEQARHLRHQTVTTRATALLKNDQTKLSQFRTHISAYRSGTTSAPELIDSFFSLFDCPSSELGKLIRELADLYEEDGKRQRLLEAWNSWRSINEDYPSLPGPSGTLPGVDANLNVSSGRRVLKLKSSTAQSSRSAVSRSGSWGTALANGSRDPFPALSSVTGRSQSSITAPWTRNTAVNASSTKVSMSSVQQPRPSTAAARIVNSSGPPPTMSQRQNEDMFPSLPAAAKPNLMMAGFNTRGSAKWGSGTNTPAAWGVSTPQAGGAGGIGHVGLNGASDALGEPDDDSGVAGKKKGKKVKKQVLYQFG